LRLTGFATIENPDITRLEIASVHNVNLTTADESGTVAVEVTIDLTWTGNNDAATRIDHSIDAGHFRQERFETATINGTLTFGDNPLWPGGTAFTADDLESAVMGHANEILL